MSRAVAFGVWALLLSGCHSVSPSLVFPPVEAWDLPCAPEGEVRIEVRPVVDLRPDPEREGATPEVADLGWALVPTGLLNVYVQQTRSWGPLSSQIPGSALELEAVRASLRAQLSACAGLRAVESGERDFVLEVELLHLVGASWLRRRAYFETEIMLIPLLFFWVIITDGDDVEVEHVFASHATATLRLRLREPSGRLLAERVVTNAILDGPPRSRGPDVPVTSKRGLDETRLGVWGPSSVGPPVRVGQRGTETPKPNSGSLLYRTAEAQRALGLLARQALRGALFKARALVAGWVLEERAAGRTASSWREGVAAEHAQGHRFWVCRSQPDRGGARFVEVPCRGGALGADVTHGGAPLVGPPGTWLVSPTDAHGVRFPTGYYAALTEHLSQRYHLRRDGLLDAYTYLGSKAQRPHGQGGRPDAAPLLRQ